MVRILAYVNCSFFVFCVVYFGVLGTSIFDSFKAQEVATTLFDPSMTLDGILIAVIPIVSFSLSDQIAKTHGEVAGGDWEKETKLFVGKENSCKVDDFLNSYDIATHDFRSGILAFITLMLLRLLFR